MKVGQQGNSHTVAGPVVVPAVHAGPAVPVSASVPAVPAAVPAVHAGLAGPMSNTVPAVPAGPAVPVAVPVPAVYAGPDVPAGPVGAVLGADTSKKRPRTEEEEQILIQSLQEIVRKFGMPNKMLLDFVAFILHNQLSLLV